MAMMYVKRYQRKQKTQMKDEFFVNEIKYPVVCQYKTKIENMYNIYIQFEEKPVEGGRWMLLHGEPVDRRNAKNYIKAICQPEELKQVKFPASTFTEFSKGSVLENIEKSTNAVIRPLKDVATFEISGTELGVTLALSQMEEIAGSMHLDPNEEQEENCMNDENVFQISPHTNNASKRLATQLERALSEHSDGICSVEDYRNAPPSVKRVLVNCLADNEFEDIDDNLLFDDGQGDMKEERKKQAVENSGHASLIRIYIENENKEENLNEPIELDGERGTHDETNKLQSDVDSCSEKLSEPWITSKIAKQQQYLKNFGISVGFAVDRVQRALKFVDEKTRPSDFLDILNGLSATHSDEDNPEFKESEISLDHNVDSDKSISDDEEVVILETETIDLETGTGETVKHDSTEKNKKKMKNSSDFEEQNSGQGKSSNNSLPDDYREQLVRDFLQESDNNLPLEELKRRNAERQRLLRETFLKQENNEAKMASSSQTGSKKKGKNKKKKQNKSKQEDPRQPQQSQSGKFDPHEKQLNDTTENKTYSQDEEQTCVMRIWNNSIGQSDSACAPYQTNNQFELVQSPRNKYQGESSFSNVIITGSKNSHPGTKSAFSSQASHNWSQPIARRPDYYRQNSPTKAKPFQWNQHQHQGSPTVNVVNREKAEKPTQVVTPNFSGSPQPPMSQLTWSDPDDLRYIVIDGSNVAMTHGNGKYFSCKGLRICVDHFKQRGHAKITVFVPQWRTKRACDSNPILDQNILQELKDEEVLVFTPSRKIGQKLVASYDDRFVMELAEAEDGIIVSNDQYRDLMQEKSSWRKMVEERLLMYSFVKDRFMLPNDPLGRDGPCLDEFLRKTDQNTMNYGAQGYRQQRGHDHQGYFHQREGDFPRLNIQGHQNVFQRPLQTPQKSRSPFQHQRQNYGYQIPVLDDTDGRVRHESPGKGWRPMAKGGHNTEAAAVKGLSVRSERETESLFAELKNIFPETGQEETIRKILSNHDSETDLVKLTNYCMSVFFL